MDSVELESATVNCAEKLVWWRIMLMWCRGELVGDGLRYTGVVLYCNAVDCMTVD